MSLIHFKLTLFHVYSIQCFIYISIVSQSETLIESKEKWGAIFAGQIKDVDLVKAANNNDSSDE